MRAWSPRERRLVAIGLLVAFVALVQLAIVGPILDGFARRSEARAALLLEYQHNARAIAAVPRHRRAAEAQRVAVSRFVQAAPDPAAANDLLRERIERIVGEVGGEFQAADEAIAAPGWTAARATARLTLPQLTQSLARLRGVPPWLSVDTLDVAADEALVNGRLNPMEVTLEATIPLGRPVAR